MTEYNAKFASCTTSIAFQLTLSRKMVALLTAVALDTRFMQAHTKALRMIGAGYDTEISTSHALARRGLIQTSSDAPEDTPGIWELTEAGKHVFALLEAAGLTKTYEKHFQTFQAEIDAKDPYPST